MELTQNTVRFTPSHTLSYILAMWLVLFVLYRKRLFLQV